MICTKIEVVRENKLVRLVRLWKRIARAESVGPHAEGSAQQDQKEGRRNTVEKEESCRAKIFGILVTIVCLYLRALHMPQLYQGGALPRQNQRNHPTAVERTNLKRSDAYRRCVNYLPTTSLDPLSFSA